MTRAAKALLLIAAVATCYAIASFVGGLPEWKLEAIAAVLALSAVIHLEENEHEKRRRMARYRADVWDRRDLESL